MNGLFGASRGKNAYLDKIKDKYNKGDEKKPLFGAESINKLAMLKGSGNNKKVMPFGSPAQGNGDHNESDIPINKNDEETKLGNGLHLNWGSK